MLPCEKREFFKHTYFEEYLQTIASVVAKNFVQNWYNPELLWGSN